MRNFLFTAALVIAGSLAAPALASTTVITDPVGDFVPSYTGPPLPPPGDLDVTSFSVGFNGASFTLSATMAAPISTTSGFYVIGVNRGGAGTSPFASIGEPGVIFNTVIVLQQNATGVVTLLPGSTTPLDAGAVTINGMTITAIVPLALLPSTGLDPANYGFNVWPRSSAAPAGNGAITDFAPNNTTISPAPEPATWAMLILGMGLIGVTLRRRRPGLALAG